MASWLATSTIVASCARERLVCYEREDWSQLRLAYAITTHRLQGSEWDNVVVVVSSSHWTILQRNLVYTAVTRARRRCVLIVSGGLEDRHTGEIRRTALEIAVKNDKFVRRYTRLAERLASMRLMPGQRAA